MVTLHFWIPDRTKQHGIMANVDVPEEALPFLNAALNGDCRVVRVKNPGHFNSEQLKMQLGKALEKQSEQAAAYDAGGFHVVAHRRGDGDSRAVHCRSHGGLHRPGVLHHAIMVYGQLSAHVCRHHSPGVARRSALCHIRPCRTAFDPLALARDAGSICGVCF